MNRYDESIKYGPASNWINKESRQEFFKRWASDMRKEKYHNLTDVVKFGKYKDQTVQEIVTKDPGYIRHTISHIKWFKLTNESIDALNKNAKSYTHFYSHEDYIKFAESVFSPEKNFTTTDFFEETLDEKKRLLQVDVKKLRPQERQKLIALSLIDFEKEHLNAPFCRDDLMLSARDKENIKKSVAINGFQDNPHIPEI